MQKVHSELKSARLRKEVEKNREANLRKERERELEEEVEKKAEEIIKTAGDTE